MRDLRLLLTLEGRARYGFGRFRHEKDPKARRRTILLGVAWVVIGAVMVSYVAGYAYLLCSVGQESVVPAFLAVVAAVLVVVVGLFRAGEAVFGTRGYDLLVSMPLRPWVLPLSRLLLLYGENAVLTAGVLLPGLGVYAVMTRPWVGFYGWALPGVLLLPVVPTGLSVLLGTAVTAISAWMKRKSLVGSLLMVGFVLVAVLGMTVLLPLGMMESSDDLTPERIGEMMAAVSGTLTGIYPPARWFGAVVSRGTTWPLSVGCLVGVSAVVLITTAWPVCGVFHSLVRRLGATRATHDYRLTTTSPKGLTRALYVREARRYISSTVYVTNTILGPILGAVMAVVLLIVGVDTLQDSLPTAFDLATLLPVLLAAVFCLMTTTSVSLSMEGRQMELVQSMPIPRKQLLDAKLLWNLTLMLPGWAVAIVCLIIALRPTVAEALWLCLFPLFLLLFSAVLGLTVDLRFHRFDNDNETAVVKQSLSAMLGGFAGPLVALVCMGVLVVVPERFLWPVEGGICVGLAVVTAMLYRRNNRGELTDLT